MGWGVIGGLAGLGMLGLACSGSPHLDPPTGNATTGAGGATSSSSTAGGGQGGSLPMIDCQSNSDCPEPTAICDTQKDLCVECLEIEDCAFRPGTVCSQGA